MYLESLILLQRAVIIICFASITSSCGIDENANKKLEQRNTTTLYPIRGVPHYFKDEKPQVHKETSDEGIAVGAAPKIHRCDNGNRSREENSTMHSEKVINISGEAGDEVKNEVSSNNGNEIKTDSKESATWKINATYAAPSSVDDEGGKTKEEFEDFKPSPHLGNFYDEDGFGLPPEANRESFKPYTPPSSASFEKQFHRLNYMTPGDSYQRPSEHPYYGFEQTKFNSGSEPGPTADSASIPAGGLYDRPDAFQEKPSSDGDSHDFGLQFKGQKETSVKKRVSLWRSVLHLVTSLLPIGLVVSALTPNLITLENVDNGPRFASRFSRSSEDASSLPDISDGCKRRLLCEIHSNHHYVSDSAYVGRTPCSKVHCEDPRSMGRLLRWLLDRNRPGYRPGDRPGDKPGYRPGDHDRRGYIIT